MTTICAVLATGPSMSQEIADYVRGRCKVVAVSDEPVPRAAPGAPGAASGRTTTSTYETPEERKIKQLYIIRQSSISNAIDVLKHNSTDKIQVEDVFSIEQ